MMMNQGKTIRAFCLLIWVLFPGISGLASTAAPQKGFVLALQQKEKDRFYHLSVYEIIGKDSIQLNYRSIWELTDLDSKIYKLVLFSTPVLKEGDKDENLNILKIKFHEYLNNRIGLFREYLPIYDKEPEKLYNELFKFLRRNPKKLRQFDELYLYYQPDGHAAMGSAFIMSEIRKRQPVANPETAENDAAGIPWLYLISMGILLGSILVLFIWVRSTNSIVESNGIDLKNIKKILGSTHQQSLSQKDYSNKSGREHETNQSGGGILSYDEPLMPSNAKLDDLVQNLEILNHNFKGYFGDQDKNYIKEILKGVRGINQASSRPAADPNIAAYLNKIQAELQALQQEVRGLGKKDDKSSSSDLDW